MIGTSPSSGRPTGTGTTDGNAGGNQSGGIRSLPDAVAFGLLSLIAGLAVVF